MILNNKFKPHGDRIVLSLQYQKLKKTSHESIQEWMGTFQNVAIKNMIEN